LSSKKYFILLKGGEDTGQVFASKQPRGAALKAASRGETDIHLRERGTSRVHMFKGWREQVAKPATSPAWLPDKIWKANVKKVGIETLEQGILMKKAKAKAIKRDDVNDFNKGDFNKGDFNKGEISQKKDNINPLDSVLEKMSKQELIDMIHRLTKG
jgi:hypothetical protein